LTDLDKSEFWKTMSEAERPMIIVGMGALQQAASSVTGALDKLRAKLPNLRQEDWEGVNFLHTNSGRAAAHDIGFVPGTAVNDKPKVAYLLGADEDMDIPADTFVIYQGSHGDKGAHRANIILPGTTYTEKSGTYVNMEGRVQRTQAACDPVGEARQDWAVVRALSEVMGARLPYDDLQGVRDRLEDVAPHFKELDEIEFPSAVPPTFAVEGSSSATTFTPLYDNHWMTNAISRSSSIMARCAAQMPNATNSYTKASA